jgi:hypothetical protein
MIDQYTRALQFWPLSIVSAADPLELLLDPPDESCSQLVDVRHRLAVVVNMASYAICSEFDQHDHWD